MWLWSAKPASAAARASGAPPWIAVLASASRRIVLYRSGLVPYAWRNWRAIAYRSIPATRSSVAAGVCSQAWAASSRDYSIRFAVDAVGTTTYDIVDNASGKSMLTNAPAASGGPYARVYTAGTAIAFKSQGAEPAFDEGVQLGVTGAPKDGDTIQVRGTRDVFASLNGLIKTLEAGVSSTPASHTSYQNGLNDALNSIDRALDQVLTTRSSVGAGGLM